MTLKEFQKRTDIILTAEEFEKVNALYLEAGDIDKDAFCEDFKKHRDSILLEAYFNQVNQAKHKCDQFRTEREQMVNFLIDQAEKWSAGDLRDQAIKLIGRHEYLKRKITKGYNLWQADKDLLLEILQVKEW